MLDFRILGPLEVVGEKGPIHLGGPKQRATLAILLLSANRVVSVERLADDLYSGAAPVTAVTQVQRQISELRKILGSASGIETRPPGYVIHVSSEQLDLGRFERRTEEATQALARGDASHGAEIFRDALGLWRGAPLADLADESFAQISIARLDEIRLAALELRIEADLALGRHRTLVGELEELVLAHPLREGLHAQLMLALYRSGRQAEALDVYRRTRETLVEEFGIDTTRRLRELERAILSQDSSLDLERSTSAHRYPGAESSRAVLVLPSDGDRLDELLTVAEPLARLPARELIIARLLANDSELEEEASLLNARRASLSVPARTAVFTTLEPAGDVARLATMYDVDLLLLDAPPDFPSARLPDDLAEIFELSPADVAVLTREAVELKRVGDVSVPFGGGEHDWAALELAAWLASVSGVRLRLVGTRADPRRGSRDASRLLADASLAVQRVIGVETQPALAEPTEEALVAAVEAAALVVVGVSAHWRAEGIGASRRALISSAHRPTLLVHRGTRPGGLAPHGSRTRFTWSIES